MKEKKEWLIENLPLDIDIESKKVLKKIPAARAALAELKGIASTIPNQNILINTLGLKEAKDSSAIEHIVTTHDELYKSELNLSSLKSLEAKEVQWYVKALKKGFSLVQDKGLLTSNIIIKIQEVLEQNKAGFRKLPGTSLKNESGQTIYTPPQNIMEIKKLMADLEQFINIVEISDYDPLVKMAIIHFQFESIHPFYDGNGRTGRIVNILYLILNDLLDSPILYLSSYIIKNKANYYKCLQEVRDANNWEQWLLFMIEGVEQTAKDTVQLIHIIKKIMLEIKNIIRDNYKFYSQDLLNNLFKHPYTKIEFLMEDLQVSRVTAASYLNQLAKGGVLVKKRIGTANYYINSRLFVALTVS